MPRRHCSSSSKRPIYSIVVVVLYAIRPHVWLEGKSVHWRQPRRGCQGHISQYFGLGDVNGNIHPILLRTFGYSRPILVALRSLSLKPISFGYKTPPIRFSRLTRLVPTNLELALTSLSIASVITYRLRDRRHASLLLQWCRQRLRYRRNRNPLQTRFDGQCETDLGHCSCDTC